MVRIETMSVKSHVLQGAIITHAVIAVAVPACAAASIMFMGSRHGGNSELAEKMFFDPDVLNRYIIGFSIVGIIAAYLFIYFNNYKRKFIIAVEFDDVNKKVILFHKSYYNNQIKSTEIPYANLSYQSKIGGTSSNLPNFSPVKGIDSNDLIVDDKISIFNNKQYSGEIAMGGTYWNKEGGKVKIIINKMIEIQSQKA